MTNEWKQLLKAALPVIDQVAAFILAERGKVRTQDIEIKTLNSFVSYVDKQAEVQLVEKLGKLLPGATFVTEEDIVENKETALTWIIDPLDGTSNFLNDLPFFSISVALRSEGKLVLGIVKEVVRDESYYAWSGGGSYMNGSSLKVSTTDSLKQAMLATGFPYADATRTEKYLQLFCDLVKNSRAIRRFGSAALDLAYVASGKFDAYYEYQLNPWDVSAGGLLVKEAGGIMAGFHDKNGWESGDTIIAASPGIFSDLQSRIRQYFPAR